MAWEKTKVKVKEIGSMIVYGSLKVLELDKMTLDPIIMVHEVRIVNSGGLGTFGGQREQDSVNGTETTSLLDLSGDK